MEKCYHGDLNEILINMRIANFHSITQLTACLLSILPADKTSEHEKVSLLLVHVRILNYYQNFSPSKI